MSSMDVEDLSVNYGKTPVLWDISFRIPKGLLVGIIGPNGAGKSTLLKAALGLVKPLSGKIDLLGEPASKMRHCTAGPIDQTLLSGEKKSPVLTLVKPAEPVSENFGNRSDFA